MLTQMFRDWWLFALRGVLAILFGVMAFIWPGQTLLALVVLFGAFALADGIFAVSAGLTFRLHDDRWWAVVLAGVAGILIGVLTFVWPNLTAHVLLYLIAAWAVITGILEIVAAIQLRRVIPGEWAAILSGALSILFGALLFAFPSAGALSLVWLIGSFAIGFGVSLLVLAFHLRGLWREVETAAAH